MYIVFLAGGIASGKSTVARELERLGAWRIDLDEVSRTVLEPGAACLDEVVAAFGSDLVDAETGVLDRKLLAQRAFVDVESAARLEDIELPYIQAELMDLLEQGQTEGRVAVCVVEVPLLDRVGPAIELADEVIAVCCPLDVRRVRAEGRGNTPQDFDRRAANQPSDEWLRAHVDVVIENIGDRDDLVRAAQEWWCGHGWSLPSEG